MINNKAKTSLNIIILQEKCSLNLKISRQSWIQNMVLKTDLDSIATLRLWIQFMFQPKEKKDLATSKSLLTKSTFTAPTNPPPLQRKILLPQKYASIDGNSAKS